MLSPPHATVTKSTATSRTVHLEAAIQVARDFDLGPDVLVAAALHDLLEDTDTTFDEIVERFGEEVATLAHCVTGEGSSRRERQRSIVEKILGTSNEQAANLKLADRIANVEAACTEGLFGLIEMYRQELPLYDAAFRLGKPEMYARLKAALKS